MTFLQSPKKYYLYASFVLIIVAFLYGLYTGKLSYPWILLDRQSELISRCVISSTTEVLATSFNFRASVPATSCVVPHRIFPEDGTVQIIPRGLYGVISEYAKGSIINASEGTLLFEPLTKERNAEAIVHTLIEGGFINQSSVQTYKNSAGLTIIEVTGASSIEPKKIYNWAFIDNPDGKSMVSILIPQKEKQNVFHTLIKTMNQVHS